VSQFVLATNTDSALEKVWTTMAKMCFIFLPPVFLFSSPSSLLKVGEKRKGFDDLDTVPCLFFGEENRPYKVHMCILRL